MVSKYIVKKGDILSSIARLYKLNHKEIMKKNILKNTIIYVGQELIIPVVDYNKYPLVSYNTIEPLENDDVEYKIQRIYDNQDILGKIDKVKDIDNYVIKFDSDGKANFYLNPLDKKLNVELGIFDDKEYKNMIQYSINSAGKHELISMNVKSGKDYYIMVKHYQSLLIDGNNYHLRCKCYPQYNIKYTVNHIPKTTIYNRRPGYYMNPTTLTIHSTANPASTAKNERNWLTNNNNKRTASYHIVVDEKEAIECIPLNEVAWHAGDGKYGHGNAKSISMEICESGNREITFLNAIILSAKILKENGWSVEQLNQHNDW